MCACCPIIAKDSSTEVPFPGLPSNATPTPWHCASQGLGAESTPCWSVDAYLWAPYLTNYITIKFKTITTFLMDAQNIYIYTNRITSSRQHVLRSVSDTVILVKLLEIKISNLQPPRSSPIVLLVEIHSITSQIWQLSLKPYCSIQYTLINYDCLQ